MAQTAVQSFPRQHDRELQTRPRNEHTNVARLNVSETERLISLVAGGALAVFGLSRRSLPGFVVAALGGGLVCRGMTGHCNVYQALGVNTADHSPQASIPAGHGAKVEESITINKSPEELFRFWRDLTNLSRFMSHVKSVTTTGVNLSHWVVEGPFGNVEWDAEIITEKPNELIGWKSLQGSTVDTAGSVHFQKAPGDRGTEVKVSLKYNPPGGQVGAAVAWLLGLDPKQLVRDDLRRFKQLMETGTVATNAGGQPRGQCC